MGEQELDRIPGFSLTNSMKSFSLDLVNRQILGHVLLRIARYSMGAAIVLIPFRYHFILLNRPVGRVWGDYTNLLFYATDLFVCITLVSWLSSLRLINKKLKYGPSFLTFPLLGLVLIGLFSSFFSVDPVLSLYHSARLAMLFGFYLFVINEVKSLNLIWIPVAIQVSIQAIVGITQVLEGHSLGLSVLQELNLDPAWNGVSIVWADGVRSLRAYGLTDHPNILGGCLAFALLVLSGRSLEDENRWQGVYASIFALGSIGLLLTFSRAAWIAFIAGQAWIGWRLYRLHHAPAISHWRKLLAGAILLCLPFVWANSKYLAVRLNMNRSFSSVDTEKRSIDERISIISVANTIFMDRPLTGVGIGAFTVAFYDYFPQFTLNYQPPHIVLVNAATETGILGGLLYSLAAMAPWLALWRRRKKLNVTPGLIALSGALAGVTIVGFFDYYTWLLAPGRLWQWLIWALWANTFNSSLRSYDMN